MFRAGLSQHRRTFAGLFLVALVACALGVAQAFAGTGTATAPIQKKNANCGADIGTSTIGTVTFTREGTTLRERVRLTKFTPSTTYTVYLYDGGCDQLAILGYLKTDSSGAGDATFASSTFGHQSFFVYVTCHCGGVYGDSVTVKVGG
jgi:hypothetical protein